MIKYLLKISAIIGAVVVIASAGTGIYGFLSGRIGNIKQIAIQNEREKNDMMIYKSRIVKVDSTVSIILITLNQFTHRQDSANLRLTQDINIIDESYKLHLKNSQKLNELLRFYEIADSIKNKKISRSGHSKYDADITITPIIK